MVPASIRGRKRRQTVFFDSSHYDAVQKRTCTRTRKQTQPSTSTNAGPSADLNLTRSSVEIPCSSQVLAEDDATLVHANASVNNPISDGGGAGCGVPGHTDDSNDSGLFGTTLEGSSLGDNDGDDGGGLVGNDPTVSAVKMSHSHPFTVAHSFLLCFPFCLDAFN